MSIIEYAKREIHVKLVFDGPDGSGRRTNLRVIRDEVRPETLQQVVGDPASPLFWLQLSLGTVRGFAVHAHVHATPHSWLTDSRQLTLKGADAVVFVADSSPEREAENVKAFERLKQDLLRQDKDPSQLPMVLQYNKRDLPGAVDTGRLRALLGMAPRDEFTAVASAGAGVVESLKAATRAILEELSSGQAQGEPEAANPAPSREEIAAPSEAMTALTARVESWLDHKGLLHKKTEDSKLWLRVDRVLVMIELLEKSPSTFVKIRAPLALRCRQLSPEVGLHLTVQNAELLFGRFSVDRANQMILYEHTLLGDELDDPELQVALGLVIQTAQQYGEHVAEMAQGDRPGSPSAA